MVVSTPLNHRPYILLLAYIFFQLQKHLLKVTITLGNQAFKFFIGIVILAVTFNIADYLL